MVAGAVLHWADYLVASACLVAFALVGVVSGWRMKKNHSQADFLTGGSTMHWAPVGLSMMASFLSAIFVLSFPAEMYIYGIEFVYYACAFVVGNLTAAHVYLPVFYRLKVTSGYEYLEKRFSRTVRTIGAILFSFMMFIYMGVVLYTPSLALAQVTAMPLIPSVVCVGLVVTFYTALGGMKATIWNDAFQMIIMLIGIVTLIIFGSIKVGGIARAFDIAGQQGRLTYAKFNPNPFIRTTFWTQCIGGGLIQMTLYASNQTVIQKFLSAKSARQGQIAVWLSTFTSASYNLLLMLIAVLLTAYYQLCHPLAAGRAAKNDQVVPLFVMDVMGEYPGLPGLFIAAALSASLSSISGGVNALAAVTLEDFLKPTYKRLRKKHLPSRACTIIVRVLAVAYGLLTILMALLSEYMGPIVTQIALSLFGMVGSPLMGVVTLGILFPIANHWGALVGMLTSLVLTCWVGVGTVLAGIPIPKLPANITGCEAHMGNLTEAFYNSTTAFFDKENDPTPDHLKIYELSYMYYSTMAILVTIIVGLIVSIITGGNRRVGEMDPRFFYPICDRACTCCPATCREPFRCGVDYDKQLPPVPEPESLLMKDIVVPDRPSSTKLPRGRKIMSCLSGEEDDAMLEDGKGRDKAVNGTPPLMS